MVPLPVSVHSLFQSKNDLSGQFEAGIIRRSFSGFFIDASSSPRRGMGESVSISKVCGRRKRRYRFPCFPSTVISTVRFHSCGVQADFLIFSNMVLLASCIRRAASVSLLVAATRLSAARLSPDAGTAAGDRGRAASRRCLPLLVKARLRPCRRSGLRLAEAGGS